MQKHVIEDAYEVAKKNFDKKFFTFKEVYELLLKQNSSIKNSVGELYVDMLQDFRFISLGKGKWALRENFKAEDIKKISASLFGLDEYFEDDAEKYMSDLEKEELKQQKKEEIELFIEDDKEHETVIVAPELLDETIDPSDEIKDDDEEEHNSIIPAVDADEIIVADDEEIEISDKDLEEIEG